MLKDDVVIGVVEAFDRKRSGCMTPALMIRVLRPGRTVAERSTRVLRKASCSAWLFHSRLASLKFAAETLPPL